MPWWSWSFIAAIGISVILAALLFGFPQTKKVIAGRGGLIIMGTALTWTIVFIAKIPY